MILAINLTGFSLDDRLSNAIQHCVGYALCVDFVLLRLKNITSPVRCYLNVENFVIAGVQLRQFYAIRAGPCKNWAFGYGRRLALSTRPVRQFLSWRVMSFLGVGYGSLLQGI